MTAKDLDYLLTQQVSPESFVESIKSEVEDYKRMMDKRGSTANLYFTENQEIKIDTPELSRLLHLVLEDQLTNIHLAYICDCLSLSESVDITENAREIVFQLADPEINGGFISKREIIALLGY